MRSEVSVTLKAAGKDGSPFDQLVTRNSLARAGTAPVTRKEHVMDTTIHINAVRRYGAFGRRPGGAFASRARAGAFRPYVLWRHVSAQTGRRLGQGHAVAAVHARGLSNPSVAGAPMRNCGHRKRKGLPSGRVAIGRSCHLARARDRQHSGRGSNCVALYRGCASSTMKKEAWPRGAQEQPCSEFKFRQGAVADAA
jgi:hypothetical protein